MTPTEMYAYADDLWRNGYDAAYNQARADLLAALGAESRRRSFWGRHFRAGYAHAVKIVREYGSHEHNMET